MVNYNFKVLCIINGKIVKVCIKKEAILSPFVFPSFFRKYFALQILRQFEACKLTLAIETFKPQCKKVTVKPAMKTMLKKPNVKR